MARTWNRTGSSSSRSAPSKFSFEAAFVTVDPNVPSKYNATQRGELGTFTTMTLMFLVGAGREKDLLEVLSRARTAVEELWPKVRRIYEYYLVEDWKHFDKAGKAAFNDWRTVSTTHERATSAHQAVGIVAAAITDDIDDSAARYLLRVLTKHTSALKFSTSPFRSSGRCLRVGAAPAAQCLRRDGPIHRAFRRLADGCVAAGDAI